MTRKKQLRRRYAAPYEESDEPQLGFAGLLMTGATPEQAFDQIAANTHDPEVQAIFAEMAKSEEGRAFLEQAKQQWADMGLPPPWDNTLEK